MKALDLRKRREKKSAPDNDSMEKKLCQTAFVFVCVASTFSTITFCLYPCCILNLKGKRKGEIRTQLPYLSTWCCSAILAFLHSHYNVPVLIECKFITNSSLFTRGSKRLFEPKQQNLHSLRYFHLSCKQPLTSPTDHPK